MERDSFLYKARRKGQVLAHKLLPDGFMSKLYFKVVLGKKLNLEDPQTFNEKIQWCKLNYFPKNKTVVQCADKYAARDYIRAKGYENTLTPLLGVWDKAEDIDWKSLPDKFVLKCNHGCAYNIICEDKKTFDKKAAIKQLNEWLDEDFGSFNIELHYSQIKHHRIIAEEFLGSCITDYKFFCFNGEPRVLDVTNDLVHDRQAKIGFFYLNGERMSLKRNDYGEILSVQFPNYYSDMIVMAKTLAKDFPFVRVDFFLAKDKYYFSELTFTPGAGMIPFNPEKFDLEWGRMLDISDLRKKV